MNNKEFIAVLSERTGYTSREVNTKLRTFIKSMTDQLVQGNQVWVPFFGTFEVKKKNERISVHPVTKLRMLVPPKLMLIFKPSASFRNQNK